jgi:hypothetical protein
VMDSRYCGDSTASGGRGKWPTDYPKLKEFQSAFRRPFPTLWAMIQDAERKGLLRP